MRFWNPFEACLKQETNLMQAYSANQHQVIMLSWLPKVSLWLRKNALFLSQSAFSNFAPHVINCENSHFTRQKLLWLCIFPFSNNFGYAYGNLCQEPSYGPCYSSGIKFSPLDLLGVSHRILWKNENAVYRLEIPTFEKYVKYANEMTDFVIHSTPYYIKYVNRAILANLQQRPLKLVRLIVQQTTHRRLENILFPWQLITLFQSLPSWFQYVSDFQLEKR